MAQRISKAAIDTLKAKIRLKIAQTQTELPADLLTRSQQEVIKEKGWEKLARKWETAFKAVKEAEARLHAVAEEVLTETKYTAYKGHETLGAALKGSTYNQTSFGLIVAEKFNVLRAQTPAGKKILELEKLLSDIDLTLELATSPTEVKEALKNILAQIEG